MDDVPPLCRADSGIGGRYTITERDQLVYAYTWPQCGPDLGVPPHVESSSTTPSAPPPDDARCTAWLFVDAMTGEMIDQTWTT